MTYTEYKVHGTHDVEKKKNFCDILVNVKIEGEKHIYIITAKHSYQYLSLIVISL